MERVFYWKIKYKNICWENGNLEQYMEKLDSITIIALPCSAAPIVPPLNLLAPSSWENWERRGGGSMWEGRKLSKWLVSHAEPLILICSRWRWRTFCKSGSLLGTYWVNCAIRKNYSKKSAVFLGFYWFHCHCVALLTSLLCRCDDSIQGALIFTPTATTITTWYYSACENRWNMTSVTREGAANQCQAFSRWKSPYWVALWEM